MGGSSGQQPVTQQTTQTKDPWGPSQQYLQEAMANAHGLFGSDSGYQPYTGNTTANLYNQYSNPGFSDVMNIAASEPSGSTQLQGARSLMGDLVTNQGLNTGLQTAAGQYGDIYSRALGNENPYLQGVINQQMDRVNSAMSGSGRYGSGMHDAAIAQAIAPTLAQDYTQRQQLQMAATGAMGDIYGQGLQRAGNAAQLIPQLDEARYAGAGHLMDLGQQQRSYEQALLDQALKLHNAQQARPWEQLARFQAVVGGAGGLGGQQITSTPGATQPSTMQRVLGGGLAGAGLGSAIFPGIGTGIGAAAGGLMGLM
jgi:hypothetical protein